MGRVAKANPLWGKLGLEIVLEFVSALHAALEGPASIAIDDLLVIVTS
jgi:hypothetical protein